MSKTKILFGPKLDSKLNLLPDDIRWGTPYPIAAYRAARLRCSKVVDLCCGVGAQSLAFARTCRQVISIDIDPQKIRRARSIASRLGVTNISFHIGDIINAGIVRLARGADIIFCDPERLVSEPARHLGSIIPDIASLLEIYRGITPNIALELPPQLSSIPFDCEREYISLDGSLSRLTVYFGTLRTTSSRAVILCSQNSYWDQINGPSSQPYTSIFNDPTPDLTITPKSLTRSTPRKYLLEVDPAIIKADLLCQLSTMTGTSLCLPGKNTYFTSSEPSPYCYFKNQYQIIFSLPWDRIKIKKSLLALNASQVTLRYTLESNRYWSERNYFERHLSGQLPLQLFRYHNYAMITKKITPNYEQQQ